MGVHAGGWLPHTKLDLLPPYLPTHTQSQNPILWLSNTYHII